MNRRYDLRCMIWKEREKVNKIEKRRIILHARAWLTCRWPAYRGTTWNISTLLTRSSNQWCPMDWIAFPSPFENTFLAKWRQAALSAIKSIGMLQQSLFTLFGSLASFYFSFLISIDATAVTSDLPHSLVWLAIYCQNFSELFFGRQPSTSGWLLMTLADLVLIPINIRIVLMDGLVVSHLFFVVILLFIFIFAFGSLVTSSSPSIWGYCLI